MRLKAARKDLQRLLLPGNLRGTVARSKVHTELGESYLLEGDSVLWDDCQHA